MFLTVWLVCHLLQTRQGGNEDASKKPVPTGSPPSQPPPPPQGLCIIVLYPHKLKSLYVYPTSEETVCMLWLTMHPALHVHAPSDKKEEEGDPKTEEEVKKEGVVFKEHSLGGRVSQSGGNASQDKPRYGISSHHHRCCWPHRKENGMSRRFMKFLYLQLL